MASRLLDETAKGVYIISATPFTDTGDIDFDSTDSLVDFYLESGVQRHDHPRRDGRSAEAVDRRVGGLHRARAQARQRPGPGRGRRQQAPAISISSGLNRQGHEPGGGRRHGLARFRAEDRRADRRLFRRRGEGTRRPGADRAAGLPQLTQVHMSAGLINQAVQAVPEHEDVQARGRPRLAQDHRRTRRRGARRASASEHPGRQ